MNESITVVSPSNIALVKYWGKRDDNLNLPINSSLSITLDETVSVTSTLAFSRTAGKDTVTVNGKKLEDKEVREYAGRVMDRIRSIYGEVYVSVLSSSDFPESAGLASSAAGVAAVAVGANAALGLGLTPKEVSMLARVGSGSACRSVFGGFVVWWKGYREDGQDSYCEQVFLPSHWPELVDVIAVLSAKKKPVSSRKGMERFVRTSWFKECRTRVCEEGVKEMIETIGRKDKERLFELIMRHSNNMHAAILDSWPPIVYLNSDSFKVMEWVLEEGVGAYTFDAGPNPHVITTAENAGKVEKFLKEIGGTVITSKIGYGPKII